MRKEALFIIFLIFAISLASATITLEQTPQSIYNLGDTLNVPIKITAETPISDSLSVILKCGTIETEIYKESIFMQDGEKFRDISIPLVNEFIGKSLGNCLIYYKLGEQAGDLSSNFLISNKIILSLNEITNEVSPGETIFIIGTATKQNGEFSSGTIEAKLLTNLSQNPIYSNAVNNGEFSIQITIPGNLKAGEHSIYLYVYEKNSEGQILNNGTTATTIKVKQVPTSLEITLQSFSINPGENLKGKITLHDQTGENIPTTVYASIKNNEDTIIKKLELQSNEEFEYAINQTQPPASWKISAYYNELTNVKTFDIKEKKEIKSEILNNTLILTNVGNVPYNEIVEIKIGEQPLNLEVNLGVSESKKFKLTAPNGEYVVQIGDHSQTVSLTGKSVSVKDFSENIFSLNPFIWGFVLLVLIAVSVILIKRVHKQPSYGRARKYPSTVQVRNISELHPDIQTDQPIKKGSLTSTASTAELSLSITGQKQQATIVSVNLKGYTDLISGGLKETLQKLTSIGESRKGLIYQTRDNLFVILAPFKTKTFQNENTALEIAREFDDVLKNHNKLFKQKVNYGVAIDIGDLVIKPEKDSIKFMPITNTLTNLKKMSNYADKEIYLSDAMKDKLASAIRTERVQLGNSSANRIKEIVRKSGDNSTFLKGFMERMERDKRQQQQ